MAGDWLKVRINLKGDPAVIAITEATDCVDEDHVVGKLISLWSWADQQTIDGNAASVTEKWIDRYLSVTGFASAMQDVGWLDVTDHGVAFPNFDRHNGQSAKKRALTAKRVTKHKAKSESQGNATSVTSALPREEKRREEKRRVSKDTLTVNSLSNEFTEWYKLYPKKVAKKAAEKAYTKAVKDIQKEDSISKDEAISKLLSAVKAYAASDKGKGEYCTNPATWLNAGSYDDDPSAWKDRNGKAKSNGSSQSRGHGGSVRSDSPARPRDRYGSGQT